MTHLTDEQLNEILEVHRYTGTHVHTYTGDTASPVTRHLDTCPDCRARLEELRSVFTALESLSEVRPPRDLTAPILAHLPQQHTSPAWKWLFAAQIFGALAIAAWLASSFELPAAMLAYQPPTFDTFFTSLFTFISSSLNLPTFDLQLSTFNLPLSTLNIQLTTFNLELSTFNLAFLIVSVAALWLVGNGLLLRAPARRSR